MFGRLRDNYIFYSLLVLTTWGVVPALAKIGGLPGGQTTMWVNTFGVIGVFIFMLIDRSFKFSEFKANVNYRNIILLGTVWPLMYSIAYFTSIDKGTSSMTIITNYTWPVFFLLFSILAGRAVSKFNWIVVLLAFAGVATPFILEHEVRFFVGPILLGLTAAACQAVYSLASEYIKANDWVTILVVQAVTAAGALIYAFLFEVMVTPSLYSIYIAIILGVFSGSLGFYAFTKAGKLSAIAGAKPVFLSLMSLIPFIQMIVIPLLKVESVPVTRWIGVILVVIALLVYRLADSK